MLLLRSLFRASCPFFRNFSRSITVFVVVACPLARSSFLVTTAVFAIVDVSILPRFSLSRAAFPFLFNSSLSIAEFVVPLIAPFEAMVLAPFVMEESLRFVFDSTLVVVEFLGFVSVDFDTGSVVVCDGTHRGGGGGRRCFWATCLVSVFCFDTADPGLTVLFSSNEWSFPDSFNPFSTVLFCGFWHIGFDATFCTFFNFTFVDFDFVLAPLVCGKEAVS